MGIKFIDDELVIGGGDWELAPFKFSKILKIGGGGSSPTYEDIVISGNGSVTLANAKANGLNYVKLFGACEQPQPANPNLFNGFIDASGTGITVNIMDDNSVRINGSRTSASNYTITRTTLAGMVTLPTGTYTLAVYNKPEGDYTGTQFQLLYSGSSTVRHYVDLGSETPYTTFTLDAQKTVLARVHITANTTYDNYIIKPMLVAGSTAPAEYTPTLPCKTNPVAIKCNNGDLKMVDNELPTGYKRVLGYTCNNDTLWQITGFKLRGSDTVRISFSVNGACNVFGCYQGTDAQDNYDLYVSVSSGSKYLRYADGTYLSYWSPSDIGQRFNVVFTPTGTSGMPQDSTWQEKTFTSANNLLLGTTTLTGTSSKLKGDLYGNFVVDGRLKLIPCERVSDGSLGYYDTYSQTFFEPTGTPTSLGYDSSHYVLDISGTTETVQVHSVNVFDKTKEGALMVGFPAADGKWNETASFRATCCKLSEGRTYTITRVTSTPTSSAMRVIAYDKVPTNAYYGTALFVGTNVDKTTTITVPTGKPYIATYVKHNADSITDQDLLDGFQIELGSTATTYEPYWVGGSAMAENLLGLGTSRDVQNITTGDITRNIGVYVFDGTETMATATMSGRQAVRFTSSGWGASADVIPMCNYFRGTEYDVEGYNACFWYTSSTSYFYCSTNFNNVDSFRTWLVDMYNAGTPMIVVYKKATATTESVTPQTLTTKSGDNTIEITQASINNLPLEVSYKGVVEEQQGE